MGHPLHSQPSQEPSEGKKDLEPSPEAGSGREDAPLDLELEAEATPRGGDAEEGPDWTCADCASVNRCRTVQVGSPFDPPEYEIECLVCGSNSVHESTMEALTESISHREELEEQITALQSEVAELKGITPQTAPAVPEGSPSLHIPGCGYSKGEQCDCHLHPLQPSLPAPTVPKGGVDLEAIEAKIPPVPDGWEWYVKYDNDAGYDGGFAEWWSVADIKCGTEADAKWVHDSRQDIPALIAEVRALRAALSKLESR